MLLLYIVDPTMKKCMPAQIHVAFSLPLRVLDVVIYFETTFYTKQEPMIIVHEIKILCLLRQTKKIQKLCHMYED